MLYLKDLDLSFIEYLVFNLLENRYMQCDAMPVTRFFVSNIFQMAHFKKFWGGGFKGIMIDILLKSR